MCEGCADTCKHVLMKARTISGEKKLIEIAWPTQAMADLSVLPSVNNVRVFFFSNYYHTLVLLLVGIICIVRTSS